MTVGTLNLTDDQITEAAFVAALLDVFGEPMTLEELAKLGQRMRGLQREYHRTKSETTRISKESFERKFDQACGSAMARLSLFGQTDHAIELAKLGMSMRSAQDEFQRTNAGPAMWAAKAREAKFDAACVEALAVVVTEDDGELQ